MPISNGSGLDTAFGHHAACHAAVLQACAREGIPALAAAFGPAQIDKAILDALLRAYGRDVFSGLGENIAGLDARLTPDIDDGIIAGYLRSRNPQPRIMVRHTVGMADPVDALPAIHAQTGCRYFKLKLSGDVAADIGGSAILPGRSMRTASIIASRSMPTSNMPVTRR